MDVHEEGVDHRWYLGGELRIAGYSCQIRLLVAQFPRGERLLAKVAPVRFASPHMFMVPKMLVFMVLMALN